jgi:phenylacetate-coenzyme A ligase PaaK-like adenylate-forming protein
MNHPRTWRATAAPEGIRTRQDALLKRSLQTRAVPVEKFYRKMFFENGIDTRDIRSTEDLAKLPFTSKADFENPRDFVIIPDEAALKNKAAPCSAG